MPVTGFAPTKTWSRHTPGRNSDEREGSGVRVRQPTSAVAVNKPSLGSCADDEGEEGIDRFLFAAERFDHAHAALAVRLGLNGLRVSEACAANIEDMAFERGHRVLRIVGKGNKPALIPLVPRTARTIDLAVGERRDGPILLRHDDQRLDRRTAHRWVRSIGKRAELGLVHPHMLRATFIMAALDAGVPLREVQVAARYADPRTITVYDRRRQDFDRHAPYVVVAFVAGG